jgi:putative SOS response-associated peptidase YedK
VDAFYEWTKRTVSKTEGGKTKEVTEKWPVCIRMRNEEPFMLAGLFSVWRNQENEEEFPTFSIVTTSPNELLAPIHNRMPVILSEKDFDRWLDREYRDTEQLRKLLVGYSSKKLRAYRVSRVVSSSKNNVPECLHPVEEEE